MGDQTSHSNIGKIRPEQGGGVWISSSIPPSARRSLIMKSGGYLIADEAPGLNCKKLLKEAVSNSTLAELTEISVSDRIEPRGGSPARRFMTVQGSIVQDRFYHSTQTLDWLNRLTGLPLTPTGERGTFTFYRPGDFLAIHRDVIECDVAVITCLADTHITPSSGGALYVYPDRSQEPLSRIQATSNIGAIRIDLPVGQTLIILGGVIPHEIRPMADKQLRIVSILCFRVAAATTKSIS